VEKTKDFLWTEAYRPKRIEDCILTEELKDTFTQFLKQKEIPNLLLSGSAGTGKTTVAKALCEELGCDYIVINGSDEGRQIDTVRSKIKNFASTVSLTEDANHKVIIIDEADYMNAESVQPALRNFIETFYKNCRFIFTCNYKNKIIPALHSRCTVIDFKITNGQVKKTAMSFMKRMEDVLKDENIEFDKNVLAELIQKYYPDFRRTINELQRYSVRGKIDSGILFNLSEANTKELIRTLKEKRFNDMRKWVVQNLDKEPSSLFKTLYETLYTSLDSKSVPQSILILAGYQYKSAFVADQEINMVACLTEIMAGCKFK
jgi:DNA polymerase III delta prime subunit